MEQSPWPRYVYKIVLSEPPEPIPAEYPLSDLDRADGFVHLSTAAQIPAVADLFFAAAPQLWLMKLKFDHFVDAVKWEDGFPHLYGNFGQDDVQSVLRFDRGNEHSWDECLRRSPWLV